VSTDADAQVEKVAELSETLSNVGGVRVAGEAAKGEPPEASLAYALVEIEEECRAYVDEYLPRLITARSPDEMVDALTEIREGLRHLTYHVKDSPYLRGVLD
jgi:hypothetical protein